MNPRGGNVTLVCEQPGGGAGRSSNGRYQTTSFWDTILGRIIRWVAYIPVAIILLGLIEFLTALFLVWLFDGDMRMFVILGIFFGGLIIMLWPSVMAFYGVIILANGMICPTPRVGVIIFATLYFFGSIRPVIFIFTSDFEVATIVTLTILKIVFLTTTWFSVAGILTDDR